MANRYGLAVLGLLLPLWAAAAAQAAPPPDASAAPLVSQGKSGSALVEQLIGQVGSLGNYKFDGSQEAHSGNKVAKARATFYFKPASSMRVEVKDYGAKTGSVLVRSKEGEIKGKGGPQLFGMKMSLQADSRLLKMPNGLSAVECDLGTLLKRFKQQEAAGYKIVYANEPVLVEHLGTRAIVLEAQKPDESGAPVVDRVFIDPVKKLPLQWDLFENGKFTSRSTFENYQTNLQLDDSQFKI